MSRRRSKWMPLTPYQGKKRAFGEFECGRSNCFNAWSSAYSYANMWQQCEVCGLENYPYRQYPLKWNRGKSSRSHLSHLCEMCQFLGRNCSKKC